MLHNSKTQTNSLNYKKLLALSALLFADVSSAQQSHEIFLGDENFAPGLQEFDIGKTGNSSEVIVNDEEQAMFDKFRTYYDSVGAEKESANLTLKGETNWEMPEWLNGIFISSVPSQQEINGQELNHWFEGFGRFCGFRMENNEVKFTSKMLKSKWYNVCKKENKVSTAVLFTEPTPARWTSHVPFANFIGSQHHGDNNWVAMEQLADKKTFVGTTDSQVKYEIDINTLEGKDWIQFNDKLSLMNGITHSQTHLDGSVISIGMTMDMKMKLSLLVYRMHPDDHLNRKVIASIPFDKYYYQHAIGLTENYAVIFVAPVYFKDFMTGLIAGKSVSDIWTQDLDKSTQIHVISLKDGKRKVFDAKAFHFAVHFGQGFETEDGKIVIEAPTYANSRVLLDPFMRENYSKMDKMKNIDYGSKFNRFTFDFDKETLEVKELVSFKWGNIDFMQFNHGLKGKQALHSYFVHFFGQNTFDETYSWPVVKYDDTIGGIAATWAPNSTLAQEVRFVPNPEGKAQDDGVLLVVAYNFDREVTSLYVIDPKTMKTLQEYPLPYRLPQGFHAEYFPSDQIKKEQEF